MFIFRIAHKSISGRQQEIDSKFAVKVHKAVLLGYQLKNAQKNPFLPTYGWFSHTRSHMFVGVMCPTLPGIPNGGVSWTGLNPDDIATYTCDPGFVLEGSPTRMCGSDGTWSGVEPSCRRK